MKRDIIITFWVTEDEKADFDLVREYHGFSSQSATVRGIMKMVADSIRDTEQEQLETSELVRQGLTLLATRQ